MSRRLEGKRILVTGASSGIGEAVARACVGEGAVRDGDTLRGESESLEGSSFNAADWVFLGAF